MTIDPDPEATASRRKIKQLLARASSVDDRAAERITRAVLTVAPDRAWHEPSRLIAPADPALLRAVVGS